MALPSAGNSLSLSQIQSEWGGSSPISLSEYYLSSLPTGRTNYGTIPSSGAIDIADFYGTDAAVAAITIGVGNSTYVAPTQYVVGQTHHTVSDVSFGNGLVPVPSTFNLSNGRSTRYVRIQYNVTTAQYNFNLLDVASATANWPTNLPTYFPANTGWTSVTITGNGSSRTFNRTSASAFSTYTQALTNGYGYGAASWTFTGQSLIFPASHNTHSFTTVLTL